MSLGHLPMPPRSYVPARKDAKLYRPDFWWVWRCPRYHWLLPQTAPVPCSPSRCHRNRLLWRRYNTCQLQYHSRAYRDCYRFHSLEGAAYAAWEMFSVKDATLSLLSGLRRRRTNFEKDVGIIWVIYKFVLGFRYTCFPNIFTATVVARNLVHRAYIQSPLCGCPKWIFDKVKHDQLSKGKGPRRQRTDNIWAMTLKLVVILL